MWLAVMGSRQTVHVWLRWYASEGLRGLADRSSRPLWCPLQMVEARVVTLRWEHPGGCRSTPPTGI